ncbi:sugar ABC transporter ATP-binding protein [Roseibacterium sp. SDUM158017]|uniref:sugar ABC transporter ATP-binding protein n=1 Tax=Roseicyclus salinarum TaxID=3036773 RepID=UPI0024157814|nr:sugar ABC transporter ATP-binding protein [Roseibacterium sp. SDUM158017]MDG4649677.1 sugar ABC transporter ATP-binding protein [Roseibacterium sp. SDUM158017]
MMQELAISGLDKSYGPARVLRGVGLKLRAGEVHALMGENGAGKSTLIKVLAGIVPADAMRLTLDGRARALAGPEDAAALGLRFVHQELNIVPSLSVAENILLSRRTPRRLGLAVDWSAMRARAREALGRFGADHVDVDAPAGRLSTGDRMLTVLAGLVAADDTAPSVFVLDEPTAALTHAEADRLFGVIAELKARGAAILYVSHRMAEVVELADRVTVLRDGAVVLSCPMAETSREGIIEAMTGREVADAYPARASAPGEAVLLQVEDLSAGGASGVSFTLREGGVMGIAGLEGGGQSAILRAILGDLPHGGRVRFLGREAPRSAAEAWAAGMAYVPRERRREGLMLRRGIAPNVVLPHLSRLSRAGLWSRPRAERAEAEARGREVRLKHESIDQSVSTLSGGNQQKVVFARAVAGRPRLALLDEPTRGVDVGAREDIYAMIRDLGAKGTAVVMASTDLPELIGLSDRILVLRGGRQAGIVPTDGLTASALLAMIYGDRPVEAVA